MSQDRNRRQAPESVSNLGRRRKAAQAGSDEYAARKQELLDIAAQVFRSKGYERTTLADIAAAAGTDRASLYYYFANKQELYEVLIEQVRFSPSERSEIIAAEDQPAAQRLRALVVELMMAFHEHYPLLYLNLRRDWTFASDPAHAQEQIESGERHFQAFRKVIADGIRDGTFKSTLPPGLAAEAAIGMVMWSFQWFYPEKSRYSGQQIGEAFADFLLNGLAVTGPSRGSRSRQANSNASDGVPGRTRGSRTGPQEAKTCP